MPSGPESDSPGARPAHPGEGAGERDPKYRLPHCSTHRFIPPPVRQSPLRLREILSRVRATRAITWEVIHGSDLARHGIGDQSLEGCAESEVRREEEAGPKGRKRRSRRQRGRGQSARDARLPQSFGGPVFEDLGGVRIRRKKALDAHILHGHILRRTKRGNGGEQVKGRLTLAEVHGQHWRR